MMSLLISKSTKFDKSQHVITLLANYSNPSCMIAFQLILGLVQLLLSVIFFCTYVATKIDGSKWRCQIIRFIGCAIYFLVAFFVLLIGLIGKQL